MAANNQFILNLNALIKDLPIIMSDILLTMGLDAKALIQQRVQEKGLNASGGKTPDYSPMYKKQRQKKGLQTNYMDLTNTGSMWRSIGYVGTKQGKETTVSIAGRDEFTQNKINWNSEKQFEVLKLSKDEETVLDEIFAEEFEKVAITYLERGF